MAPVADRNLKHKRRYCRIPGCGRIVKSQGLCQRHGAKTRKCKIKDCEKQAQGNFDGMCKSHFKLTRKELIAPIKPLSSEPPKPTGESVYDRIIPESVTWDGTGMMPLVQHLKEGFDENRPRGWHRNDERLARGMHEIQNPAVQLEGWERELVWLEICLLSGNEQAHFRHLARAWARDKGFQNVLAQFICERQGNVERKKRIKKKPGSDDETSSHPGSVASCSVASSSIASSTTEISRRARFLTQEGKGEQYTGLPETFDFDALETGAYNLGSANSLSTWMEDPTTSFSKSQVSALLGQFGADNELEHQARNTRKRSASQLSPKGVQPTATLPMPKPSYPAGAHPLQPPQQRAPPQQVAYSAAPVMYARAPAPVIYAGATAGTASQTPAPSVNGHHVSILPSNQPIQGSTGATLPVQAASGATAPMQLVPIAAPAVAAATVPVVPPQQQQTAPVQPMAAAPMVHASPAPSHMLMSPAPGTQPVTVAATTAPVVLAPAPAAPVQQTVAVAAPPQTVVPTTQQITAPMPSRQMRHQLVPAAAPMPAQQMVSAVAPQQMVPAPDPTATQQMVHTHAPIVGQHMVQAAAPIAAPQTQQMVHAAGPVARQHMVQAPAPMTAQQMVQSPARVTAQQMVQAPAPIAAQQMIQAAPVAPHHIVQGATSMSSEQMVQAPAPVATHQIVQAAAPMTAQQIVQAPAPVPAQQIVQGSAPVATQQIVQGPAPVAAPQGLVQASAPIAAQPMVPSPAPVMMTPAPGTHNVAAAAVIQHAPVPGPAPVMQQQQMVHAQSVPPQPMMHQQQQQPRLVHAHPPTSVLEHGFVAESPAPTRQVLVAPNTPTDSQPTAEDYNEISETMLTPTTTKQIATMDHSSCDPVPYAAAHFAEQAPSPAPSGRPPDPPQHQHYAAPVTSPLDHPPPAPYNEAASTSATFISAPATPEAVVRQTVAESLRPHQVQHHPLQQEQRSLQQRQGSVYGTNGSSNPPISAPPHHQPLRQEQQPLHQQGQHPGYGANGPAHHPITTSPHQQPLQQGQRPLHQQGQRSVYETNGSAHHPITAALPVTSMGSEMTHVTHAQLLMEDPSGLEPNPVPTVPASMRPTHHHHHHTPEEQHPANKDPVTAR